MNTIEELNNEIKSLVRQIIVVDEQTGSGLTRNGMLRDPYHEENERMERYLSEFTVRQGALLTVAGLLTMLPINSEEYLKHFLIWTFPFLIIAITCYVFSSKRINFVSSGSPELLQSYEVNSLLKTTYYRSAFFHKGTDIAITVFFFSFIANYYVLTLVRDLYLLEQVLLFVISIGVGALRLWYITTSKNRFAVDAHAIGGDFDHIPVPMTKYEICNMEEQDEDVDANHSTNSEKHQS